jgi:ankyrin repeat protein
VKHLASLGANLSLPISNNKWRPIHYAAAVRSHALCEFLLSRAPADKDALTDSGATPLHIAVTAGDGETIGLLLNAGVNVNLANLNGQTALHISVVHSDPVIAELLLSFGADIKAKNRNGETAEALAQAHGNAKLAEFLAEVRASPAKVRARAILLNAARGTANLSVKDKVVLLGERVALVERLAVDK